MSITVTTFDNPLRAAVIVSGVPNGELKCYATVGRSRRLVGVTTASSGEASFDDFYPALNVDVEYDVETITGTAVASAGVRFNSDTGWLRSSIEPSRGLPIHSSAGHGSYGLLAGSFLESGSAEQGDMVTPLGARLPILLSSGVRKPVEYNLRFLVSGKQALDELIELLEDTPMCCLQALPEWGLAEPVTHFRTDYGLKIDVARNAGEAVEFEQRIVPVRPPAQVYIVALTVAIVEEAVEFQNLTVAQVEANSEGFTVAEIEANPTILTSGGS